MSVTTENQRFEQLVQKIAPGSKLLRTWELQGGISAEMTALEIEYPDGHTKKMIIRRPTQKVLKQNPLAAQNEFRLLQILQSQGLATPTPYYLDRSGQIFSTPYFILEYIEGKPEFAPARSADFILELATYLARIHSVDCAKLDLSFLPGQPERFTDYFAPPSADDGTTLIDEERIRDTLESVWPLPQRNASVLLHGDFWPGNILWQEEKLVAVIDWEDAQLGDPLSDLAISRLDILVIFGMEAMYTFTDQYKSRMPIDYTTLPYRDLCAALRLARLAGSHLAEWVAFFVSVGREDITEQTVRTHFKFFVTQAFEKLGVR